MKIYRFASVMIALVLASLSFVLPLAAVDDTVYVTISTGSLVLAYGEVPLTDKDGDGSLTINDALIIAHEKYYEDGAEGYGSAETDFGISMTKLWGIENGGGYGYCVNNASAQSLSDQIKPGDHIVAYVYTDTENFSDTYAFFDTLTASGGTVSVTLTASGYDENWNPVTHPVSGAVITVDGERTETVTDENGRATVTVSGEGSHVISAVSDTETLVPPVLILEVEETWLAPNTGSQVFVLLLSAALALKIATSTRRARV